MINIKKEKGITLIALIITIIVLLILAVVSIRAIQGDGILSQARRARDEFGRTQAEEQSKLEEYQDLIDVTIGKIPQIQSIQGTVMAENTRVVDEYGNKLVVPAGFKITQDASHVNEGIVIEDVNAGTEETVGNQFVWVPVGNIKTSKTDTTGIDIELNRYTFGANGNPTPHGDEMINDRYQELTRVTNKNKTAKDIDAFKRSVATNKGYYIARYEAGKNDAGNLVIKKNVPILSGKSEADASNLSVGLYQDSEAVESDLINSYAWDTAIVFIQKCSVDNSGTLNATNYSNKNNSTSLGNTGNDGDEYCNINNMATNAIEWSTETGYTDSLKMYWCVFRGGGFNVNGSKPRWTAGAREFTSVYEDTYSASRYLAFRTILYL